MVLYLTLRCMLACHDPSMSGFFLNPLPFGGPSSGSFGEPSGGAARLFAPVGSSQRGAGGCARPPL